MVKGGFKMKYIKRIITLPIILLLVNVIIPFAWIFNEFPASGELGGGILKKIENFAEIS